METELDSPPSLASLYARVVSAAVLPGGGDELPDRRLVLRAQELDANHVAAYARVCGFGLRSTLPATYPHVLAFPLHLELMSERSFPFSALGLLHIENRIEALRSIPIDGALDLAVWAEDLRPHPRGRQFDILGEARLAGDTAWRERSTYLRIERSGDGKRGSENTSHSSEELDLTAEWTIPGDIGRRYAAVSGDRNPIHLHPLLAKAFGAPTTIAHGMWTTAHCVAAFEGWLPEVLEIATEFRSPLRIPGRARLRSGRTESGWAIRVESPDGERAYVVGEISLDR